MPTTTITVDAEIKARVTAGMTEANSGLCVGVKWHWPSPLSHRGISARTMRRTSRSDGALLVPEFTRMVRTRVSR